MHAKKEPKNFCKEVCHVRCTAENKKAFVPYLSVVCAIETESIHPSLTFDKQAWPSRLFLVAGLIAHGIWFGPYLRSHITSEPAQHTTASGESKDVRHAPLYLVMHVFFALPHLNGEGTNNQGLAIWNLYMDSFFFHNKDHGM
jgi:hypothetical protein